MKYKLIFPYLLIIAILSAAPQIWAGQPTGVGSPNSLSQKALEASRQGNYGTALRLIQQAKVQYANQGIAIGTYSAGALEYWLRYQQRTVETNGHNTIPDWNRIGWLLKNFNYSAAYIIPPVPTAIYQGLLIFLRKVKDIYQGPGRSVPIWGVLDVRAIPKIKPGETFVGGSCRFKGRAADPGISAIVYIKGQENREVFTNIRQAWHLNTKTGKIETVPANQITCINEASGV